MRLISMKKRYDMKIWVDDEKKLILKMDCECADFNFRKIKKVGELSDIKYYAEPCKHLQPIVGALKNIGYKIKKPKEMIGSDKLKAALRKKLLERAGHKCENPKCESDILLQIHRKTRGSAGGKYNMENCIVLCKDCHDARHANEFPGSKSK